MPIPDNGNRDTSRQEIYVIQEVLKGVYESLRNICFFAVVVLPVMIERVTDIISDPEGPVQSVHIP